MLLAQFSDQKRQTKKCNLHPFRSWSYKERTHNSSPLTKIHFAVERSTNGRIPDNSDSLGSFLGSGSGSYKNESDNNQFVPWSWSTTFKNEKAKKPGSGSLSPENRTLDPDPRWNKMLHPDREILIAGVQSKKTKDEITAKWRSPEICQNISPRRSEFVYILLLHDSVCTVIFSGNKCSFIIYLLFDTINNIPPVQPMNGSEILEPVVLG